MSVTAEEIQAGLPELEEDEFATPTPEDELAMLRMHGDELAQLQAASDARAQFLDDPANEFGRGMTLGVSNMVGVPVDAVNGILNAVGIEMDAPLGSSDSIQAVFDELGGAPEGLPGEPSTVLEGAGEGIGAAAVITPAILAPYIEMAMDPNFEMRQQQETVRFKGTVDAPIPRGKAARAAFLLRQLGQNIAKTAVEHPKAFIASELAGSAAAGAAMEFAQQEGAGPGGQTAAGVTAGIVAGANPLAIPRMVRNAWRWGMKNFNPWRKAGAEPRAAEQIQIRAEDPEAAAQAALDAPEGVTGARASGEERLMAQEARVHADDAELDKMIREDLESAIERADGELRGLYDTPRGKEAWEQAVFQRIAPEGVEVPAGTSEEMLDFVKKSFKPLYEQFKGYKIMPNMFGARTTSLETMIKNVPQTTRIQTSEATREAVTRRLNALYQGLKRRVKPNEDGVPVADFTDYQKFRSQLRQEARSAMRRGDDESANLYRIAEEKVNAVLHSQLGGAGGPDVLADLRKIDSNYRNFKLIDEAIFRRSGTDVGLTPEGLMMQLKVSASSTGSYRSGAMLELRNMAAVGKPIEGMIKEPAQIRRLAARLGADDLDELQRDAFDTLLRKSTITDPETGAELLSGTRLKQMMTNLGDSLRATRMDEDSLRRAGEIADQLVMMQRKSPEAVAQLYEDGPADILNLIATMLGAKHGQNVAGKGMGSSLVLAGWFAKQARKVLEGLTTNQARIILSDAASNTPESRALFAKLLTSPTDELATQNEAAQFLKAYLANIAQRQAKELGEPDATEEYREELKRLQNEAQQMNPLF